LREERTVFPLIDRALSEEMLTALGSAWAERGVARRYSRKQALGTV